MLFKRKLNIDGIIVSKKFLESDSRNRLTILLRGIRISAARCLVDIQATQHYVSFHIPSFRLNSDENFFSESSNSEFKSELPATWKEGSELFFRMRISWRFAEFIPRHCTPNLPSASSRVKNCRISTLQPP